MRSLQRVVVLAVVSILLAAGAVQAQVITGTVRDESGAVMPGVTVEVASPALIEKVRAGSTDATGQYRILNLSAGTYTVTFTLVGFSTVRREGIELTGDFTATVNASLQVGALEETITVSGASPMVDVQAVGKQTVLTREQLDLLPTPRNIQAAGVLIPGVESARLDVGGNTKLQQPGLNFRGTGATVTRWDGFWLGNVQGSSTGGSTSFYVNDAGAQELIYSSGADSIDMGTPGLYINMIPKDGGNTFRGLMYGDFSYEPWSWQNVTDRLRSRGLTNVPVVEHVSDFNVGLGGPIKRDRLWFFGAYRYEALSQTVVDSYYDKNPSPYLYEPDLDRPGVDNGKIPNQSVRLTYQATRKDKVQFWFTNQNKYRSHYNISASRTPDATSLQNTPYAQAAVLKWTRTQNNKLLLEAGYASGRTLYQELYQPNVSPSSDRETVQQVKIYSITDQANGKVFGAYDAGYSGHGGLMQSVRVAGNYVTGSHALLTGVSVGWATSPRPEWWTGDITMAFLSGVPQSVTLRIPKDAVDGYFPDLGIFVQDRWSIKRATITGGLRYDYFVGKVEDGTLPPSRWNPSQFFPGFTVQSWKDISPRLGVAFDVFGTGRTAIKANVSRYVAAESVTTASANNPQDTIGRTDTRTWNDQNGDFTIYNPDGSLQASELGPTTNLNFGRVIATNTTRDPATLNGFNSRGSTVEWQAVMQHQVSSALAVNGGYYFRWNGNQTVTDNTLVTNADFDGPFCITAPPHPDLPGGGGYPVCGLYDVKGAARSLQQNHVTFARNFGNGIIDHIQGYDIGATLRLSTRTFVNGGVDANRRLLDTCDAPAVSGSTTNQVDNPQAQFCHQITPYRPNAKVQASHTFPGNVVVSATYQNAQGPQIVATWAVPGAIVTQALGRPQSAGATATKSVMLIEPGSVYGDRMNQIDLRASKRLQIGRYRIRGDVNLYNAFNSDFTPTVNTTFSTSASSQYLRPLTVLQGRLLKIGGQIEF